MSSQIKGIADRNMMDTRFELANEFYDAIIDPEERPWLVTDEATLFDLTLEDESLLLSKIEKHYQVKVSQAQLKKPFWKLLDYLEEHRVN